jgi:hypothetical protein
MPPENDRLITVTLPHKEWLRIVRHLDKESMVNYQLEKYLSHLERMRQTRDKLVDQLPPARNPR